MVFVRLFDRVRLLPGGVLFALALSLLIPVRVAKAKSTAPVIAAAGDVACAPDLPFYNAGRGIGRACGSARTAALIDRSPNRRVLVLGDLVAPHPYLANFRTSYLPTWGRFKKITYPVLGNHEYDHRTKGNGYFDFFNGRHNRTGRAGTRPHGWYAHWIGSWLVIALNSNCNRAHVACGKRSRQAKWLKRKLWRNLAGHPKRCLLAFWHQPRFSSGYHGGDQPVGTFWRILRRWGADVILNGHEHLYERFGPQDAAGHADKAGPVQFTVGTGGRSLFSFKPEPAANSRVRIAKHFGILRLRLMRGRYRWRYVTVDEGVQDHGSKSCGTFRPH